MITFWLILAAMAVTALVFVVPPLLGWGRKTGVGRDEMNLAIHRERLKELEADLKTGTLSPRQFSQAREELEKQLLQDVSGTPARPVARARGSRWSAVAVGLALPVVALGLYVKLGGYGTPAFQNPAADAEQASAPGAASNLRSVDEMVATLANRLKNNPDDAQGWRMLGRSYAVLQRYTEAAHAYAKAYELNAQDPQLMGDYAESLALANDGRLEGRPSELVAKALAVEPNNPKALWLSGIAALQKGDKAQAAARWDTLLALLPKGSDEAQMVEQAIAEARGQAVPQTVAQAGGAEQAAAAGARLKVKVALAPELTSKASPEDTVFIFARAPQGPPMPLAIVRKQVKDLPAEVVLDDSLAMSATMKLSSFPEVALEARVSKSGNAMPEAGDLQAPKAVVKVGGEGRVELVIAEVVGAPGGGTPAPAASEQGGAPAGAVAEPAGGVITPGATASARPGAGLQVRVALAPHLADKVSPADTLFIYARAPQGPRLPLALVRKQARDLPTTVTLDDSSAMMPGMKLSSFPMVVLGARVSKSGNAMPQAGDLQGFSPTVAVNGQTPVEVTIDKVIP